jgi:hypothetical protein
MTLRTFLALVAVSLIAWALIAWLVVSIASALEEPPVVTRVVQPEDLDR